MNRMLRKLWTVLRLPLLLLLMGACMPKCASESDPTLTCDVVSVRLDPGACGEIPAPCGDNNGNNWVRQDGFRLCDRADDGTPSPGGLFVQTQVDPRTRFLCADANIGTLIDVPIGFLYTRPGEWGHGTLRVTVGATPLTISASANPAVILPGESSQLATTVSGGQPPYTYAWSPSSGLSANDVADPLASPSVSEQYTVVVTDSSGATAGAAVIVNVGLTVSGQANPATIDFGQTSNLSVTVAGGTPPYAFDWTPSDTLSAGNIGSPIATPLVTTTYQVTVTDFLGVTATASVTVTVNAAPVTASFTFSRVGSVSLNLDASNSTGSGPLTYKWWCDSPDGSGTPNGVKTDDPIFTCTYDTFGNKQVRLEVSDSSGNSAVTSQTINIPAS